MTINDDLLPNERYARTDKEEARAEDLMLEDALEIWRSLK
jgi:hypothetical protein